ncbi:radical SAM/SPASM domain-containing protein [Caldivirga sp.]|uniref:radical SAM protein n=1 Tax=Caldivirga sp. TaxID=2080243 RepID=UPI00345B9C6D
MNSKNNNSYPKIIQAEISTTCNASCVYCPRTILKDKWVSSFMNPRLLRKVIEELTSTGPVDYIHLQGWGEPLLHPRLTDIIDAVKGKINFGLTTNGLLLSNSLIGKLLESGINIIAVTFAGAYPVTHDSIRVGCNFKTIVDNVKRLINLKRKLRSSVKVVASYIMTSMNIHETVDFMELCHELGIEEVILDNLTYVLSKGMFKWKVFTDPMEQGSRIISRIVNATMRRAGELDLRVFAYSLNCWELSECPEKPTEAMFINVNGEVSPCVFLNLPIKDDKIPRCFMGSCFKIGKLIFGNVNNNDAVSIWYSRDYQDFRLKFIKRRNYMSQGFTENYNELMPPSQCLTCYRLYGV